MNAEQFADKLAELKACQSAIGWAKGKSLAEAWEQCERSDWMFWLLRRSTVSKKVIVAIACDIAESVAHLAKSPAANEAIKAARQYMAGEITMEELIQKRSDAYAAAYAAAAYAAAYAAAAYAAYSAAYAAAAYAAYAADAAADAADAYAKQRKLNCDIIRRHIPAAEIGNLLAAREESGRCRPTTT